MHVFLQVLLVKLAVISEDILGEKLIGWVHLCFCGIEFDSHQLFYSRTLSECFSFDSQPRGSLLQLHESQQAIVLLYHIMNAIFVEHCFDNIAPRWHLV